MRPLFGRVVLNDIAEPPGPGPAAAAESLQRASGWSLAAARAGALQAVSLGDLDGRQPRLAFSINVYNALVFPVGAYRAAALDQQLDLAACNFRNQTAGPARDALGGRARPCDAYAPYDWALQHEPAE
jgi:hypothetical protein